ncbi:MAG: beta-N-acetylhexosaminidase [Anaerolineae bacterium]|nr:beta-N-acetylhexosaminidase [Anaerolineae bacterium]
MTFVSTPSLSLIPKPVVMTEPEPSSAFELTADCQIVAADAALAAGNLLAHSLRPATGFALPVVPMAAAGQPAIHLLIDAAIDGEEAYRLDVEPQSVTLRASDYAGLAYAVQTLRQLLPVEIFSATQVSGVRWVVPGVVIEDRPRFGWRGGHLDVGRHFFPVEVVKRFVDLLALHKFNRFHWHLTEDQGWRIEIKRYPRLTEIGAWRRHTMIGHGDNKLHDFDDTPHGGFYTQEQIRDVVAYAAERGILVVPEIEMPGHAQAAIAAYPELGNLDTPVEVSGEWGISENIFNVEESTFEFLENVLLEVLDLFPSRFIHIGGDEVPKRQWNDSPRAQAYMREHNLPDADALQSAFIRRMDDFLNAHGRVLVGWDEILEGGLAENAIVMSWRGEEGGIAAAEQGHDVIMTPEANVYFDHYQFDPASEGLAIGGLTTLEDVYSYEPVPPTLTPDQAAHVLGSQGQLWTEYMPTAERLEYMAYPRFCALAEVLWSPSERGTYADFLQRMRPHAQRLDLLGIHYCRRALDEG